MIKKLSLVLPGLIFCILIALIGQIISMLLGDIFRLKKSPFSAIILAICLGILVRNIYFPKILQEGVKFSTLHILRLGIVFLGIRLTLGDILQFGLLGLPLVAFCILFAIFSTNFFAKKINVGTRMSYLIAVGSSICGASAIAAFAPLIKAKQEELAYAVANITIFGILAMLTYPFLAQIIFVGDQVMVGLFLGTAIHETAQVIGSGLIYNQLFASEQPLNVATTIKLIRNTSMAFVLPTLAYFYYKNQRYKEKVEKNNKFQLKKVFPLFIFGFIFFAFLRTTGDISLEYTNKAFGVLQNITWEWIRVNVQKISSIFLTISMAGIGLNTSLKQLKHLGIRPFYVGFIASFAVGIASIIGVNIFRLINIIL